MNQARLAQQLGVTTQQLQKYEKGINRVSVATLYEMATLFGANVQDFLAGVGLQLGHAGAQTPDAPHESSKTSAHTGEARALLEAFERIGDAQLRKQIVSLVATLARQ